MDIRKIDLDKHQVNKKHVRHRTNGDKVLTLQLTPQSSLKSEKLTNSLGKVLNESTGIPYTSIKQQHRSEETQHYEIYSTHRSIYRFKLIKYIVTIH